MYVASPLLLGPTPPGGVEVTVAAGHGGLAGYVLLGQDGPPAVLTIGGNPPTLPHTLAVGDVLRLVRDDDNPVLTTVRMLAPTDVPSDGPAAQGRDSDGYVLTSGWTGNDSDGFLTTDQTLSRDPDGYVLLQEA